MHTTYSLFLQKQWKVKNTFHLHLSTLDYSTSTCIYIYLGKILVKSRGRFIMELASQLKLSRKVRYNTSAPFSKRQTFYNRSLLDIPVTLNPRTIHVRIFSSSPHCHVYKSVTKKERPSVLIHTHTLISEYKRPRARLP